MQTVVFYKPTLAWPFESGHDVHTSQMCRAMVELGVRAHFVTDGEITAGALTALGGARHAVLEHWRTSDRPGATLSRMEQRFQSYWGVPSWKINAFGACVDALAAEAAVVSGLGVLPLLAGVSPGVARVWYAADEWVLHHLSMVRIGQPGTWRELLPALTKGIYERSYRGRVDRAWVVTREDERAMQLVMAPGAVDVLPNGVDAIHYAPAKAEKTTQTAVFWGRLDFGPNVQALEWFVNDVWPSIRTKAPTAEFSIVGFHPTDAVRRLAGAEGVVLRPDVEDIRPVVSRNAVVVLPMVSGAGIKNKFLEASALGMPIVATRTAALGLRAGAAARFVHGADEWVSALLELWSDEKGAADLGERAREWVLTEHTWSRVAGEALRALGAARSR